MIPQTYVSFSTPITLRLALPALPRMRVTAPTDPVTKTFLHFPLYVQIEGAARRILAYLSPIPAGILLYDPADFAAACADTLAMHAERVVHLLGSDPATALQALVDGAKQPAPTVRVPREIANWRAKAILAGRGQLAAVDTHIAELPEPDPTVMHLAWVGNAALSRQSQAVISLATGLGMDSAAIDAFFIEADAISL